MNKTNFTVTESEEFAGKDRHARGRLVMGDSRAEPEH